MLSNSNSTNTTLNENIQISQNEFQAQNNILNLNKLKKKKNYRKDAFGNVIKKNSKKHKVTFKDSINKGNLIETILIKQYKNKNIKTINNRLINKHYDMNFLKDYIVVNKVNCECSSCILF